MAELKTKKNDASVDDFINSVDDDTKRQDARDLVKLFSEVTGEEPKMWGKSIVGFGSYHYVYPTGREGDWMLTGFSPRKQNLTLYIMSGFSHNQQMLKQLGPHTTGKSCLYIKRLADADQKVLRKLIAQSVEWTKKHTS